MRKIIAAINMTIDGFCDHTAVDPGEEIHEHYVELIRGGDVILYGRTTYELMQFWQTLVKNPSGEKAMDDFAAAIDKIQKVVFSHTLKNAGSADLGWQSARLATRSIEEEISELRTQSGRNILVGSRSLIIQLLKLNLIDELQLCVHPVIVGSGLPLFENVNERMVLKLIRTKIFGEGAITLYYEPVKAETKKP